LKKSIFLFIAFVIISGPFDGFSTEGETGHQNRGRVSRFFSGVKERGTVIIRRMTGRSSKTSRSNADTQSDTPSIARMDSTSSIASQSSSRAFSDPLSANNQTTLTGPTQATTLVTKSASPVTPDLNTGLTQQSSSFSFQGVAASIAPASSNTAADQSATASGIAVHTSDSTSAEVVHAGRSTQPTTERTSEGAPPSIDAGESVRGEREEDDFDLEHLFNVAGKLIKSARLGDRIVDGFESFSGTILSVWKNNKTQEILGLHDSVTAVESFSERMGHEFVGRILGRDGPSKSLLAIVGPQGFATGIRYAIRKASIPGLQKLEDKIGDIAEAGLEKLSGTRLNYKARSIIDAAYLADTTAKAFYQTYAPIISTLTKDEQNDLICYAVDTAMFAVDRMILENPKATITPQILMKTIGTEFLDLDAKMPRFGMLIRRAKMAIFQSSGLDAKEARALLTSTPVQVGTTLFAPINDPRDERNLIVKAFWRGVLHQDEPIAMPKGFRNAYRVADANYAQSLGIALPPELIPQPIAIAAAPAA